MGKVDTASGWTELASKNASSSKGIARHYNMGKHRETIELGSRKQLVRRSERSAGL